SPGSGPRSACGQRSGDHADQFARGVRGTDSAVLPDFPHMLGGTRAGINDERRAVAALPDVVQQRIAGPRVRRTPHVRDDEVIGSPPQLPDRLVGGIAEVDLDPQRLKGGPFEKVVIRPVVDPQHARSLYGALYPWSGQCFGDVLGIQRLIVRRTGGRALCLCGAQGGRGLDTALGGRLNRGRLDVELPQVGDEAAQAATEVHEEEHQCGRPDDDTYHLSDRADQPGDFVSGQPRLPSAGQATKIAERAISAATIVIPSRSVEGWVAAARPAAQSCSDPAACSVATALTVSGVKAKERLLVVMKSRSPASARR